MKENQRIQSGNSLQRCDDFKFASWQPFRSCVWLLILLAGPLDNLQAQDETVYKKWQVYLEANYHLERRGTVAWETANPDFLVGGDREIFGFGDFRFNVGLRTGAYKEYVLTGNGWDHPEKYRFFVGFTPSMYMYLRDNLRFQVQFVLDDLFPNDYREIWDYWAGEAGMQYFIGDLYLAFVLTGGSYIFFDPPAQMAKAGFRLGYRF
ncbi:MAG: hypothetical protein R2751_19240 [Bacteroidales bacterium]